MAIRNNYTLLHNYTCEVWQSEQNLITTTDHDDDNDVICFSRSTPQKSELFLIDVFVTHDVVLNDDDDDDDEELLTMTRSSSRYSQFMAQKHLLLDNAMSWSMISNMLSHMLVPFHAQPFIIHKISTSAREIAARPANAASETIRLVVSLVAGRERRDEEEAARARVDDDNDKNTNSDFCVICLGEILGACEVAKLPCLHFYHEECILSWFEKSNLCPLCRFEMPLDIL